MKTIAASIILLGAAIMFSSSAFARGEEQIPLIVGAVVFLLLGGWVYSSTDPPKK